MNTTIFSLLTHPQPSPPQSLLRHPAGLVWLVVLVCVGFLFSNAALAQSDFRGGGFGLGLYLGKPIGPTAQIWLGPQSSLKVVASWSLENKGGDFILDYEYHLWDPLPHFDRQRIRFNLYCGVGGTLRFREQDNQNEDFTLLAALRIPVGFSARWVRLPFDLFAEITPGLQIFNTTKLEVKGGLGARYYF